MNKRWISLTIILTFILAVGVSAGEGHPVTSSLKVQFYGKIKADASYDDSRTSPGVYVKTVDRENYPSGYAKAKDDDKFNMTARETRLGFNVSGPRIGEADVSGKVEFDFYGAYGSGGGNNKGTVLLRHAYGKLNWAEKDASLLFGQTWDIVSPLTPRTLAYPVLWWAGNTGYRRAQLRYQQGINIGEDSKLTLQGGILDQLGSYSNLGGASSMPNLQGRVAFTIPQGSTFGLAGAIGTEKNDAGSWAQGRRFDTSGVFLDVLVPITSWAKFKGEAFKGKNLSAFLGGIGQGMNTATTPDKEINSQGGWVAGELGPFSNVSFTIGYGIDNPDDSTLDVTTAGTPIKNECGFINILYKLSEHLSFGLELSRWETRYPVLGVTPNHKARANRAQASAIYSFY